MRILPTSTVVGYFLLIGLIGTLPAAGQSIQPPQSAASSRVAVVADWKAEREAYVQKARDDVQEWQRKLHEFSEKTRTKTSEANITAKTNTSAR